MNPVHSPERNNHDDRRSDSEDNGAKPPLHAQFGKIAALTLTLTRLALGPVALVLARQRVDGRILAAAVIIAALSDVYDGKIARRFGVATPELRRFDSITDTLFYICVAIAIWMLHPTVIRSHAWLIAAFVAMQIGGHLLDLAKFGRDTSYHTWTGRAFGLALLIASVMIFWTGTAVPWLAIALIIGLISHVDALAITLVLPAWHHDVHTVRNALRIRGRVMQQRGSRTALP